MSLILVTTLKTEAGVHNNPGVEEIFNTNYDGGILGILNKLFKEVYLHWDGDLLQWVEDPVFVANQSIVALKITNPDNGQTAYLDYPYNDFRIATICCFDQSNYLLTEDGMIIETEDGKGIIV